MDTTDTRVPEWGTDELHTDARHFVAWLRRACEGKGLSPEVIERRLEYRAEMRKLIGTLQRSEATRRREVPECVFTALERLDAPDHRGITRWQSAVSQAYYSPRRTTDPE